MYNVDTLVDDAVKQTKTGLAHVPNDTVRTNLETMVDASAEYFKTLYATGTAIGKTAYESLNPLAPKQPTDKK